MKKKILFLFYRTPGTDIPMDRQGFYFNTLSDEYDCKALVFGEGKSKESDKFVFAGKSAGPAEKIIKFISGFQSPRITHFSSAEYLEKYKELIRDFQPDVIYAEHSLMMQYILKSKPSDAKIIFFDDESALFIENTKLRKNIFERARNTGMRSYELSACTSADRIITITEDEEKALRQTGFDNICNIPYPVDTDYFGYKPMRKRSDLKGTSLLFVGNFIHYPNREAVKLFAENILPNVNKSGGFKLKIAGRNTDRIKKYADEYIGIHDDATDIRSFYYNSDFLVAPILSGGGMRTKVLEAASCGLPVLMTPLANLGINFGNKKEAFIAEDTETFAYNINFLIDPMNRSLLEDVSRNARIIVENRFSYSIVKAMILRLFREVTE